MSEKDSTSVLMSVTPKPKDTDIVPQDEGKPLTRIQKYMDSPAVINRFKGVMTEREAMNYIASVMIAVADSNALQKCSPPSIYIQALRAATLRLSVDTSIGEAYLIPFGDRATLVVGYKGLVELAKRTGKYRYINAGPVYEGETVTEDRITGFHSLSGHATSKKVIGWIAAFELTDGFGKTLYMTVDEITDHAKYYSKGYDRKDNYGKFTSLWHNDRELPKMQKKTVLRLLLRRWGTLKAADAEMLEEIEGEDTPDQPITIEGELKDMLDKRADDDDNPDPVTDATWKRFEELRAQAIKAKIPYQDVQRTATTETDLGLYIPELEADVSAK
jgi:recombination protein RecT